MNVRKNFDSYADVPLNLNDGMYQPFITAATVGGEYDLSKMREVSGSLDLPIPGVNELFDLNARILVKTFLLHNSAIEFPLTLSDPNERAPYNFRVRFQIWQYSTSNSRTMVVLQYHFRHLDYHKVYCAPFISIQYHNLTITTVLLQYPYFSVRCVGAGSSYGLWTRGA